MTEMYRPYHETPGLSPDSPDDPDIGIAEGVEDSPEGVAVPKPGDAGGTTDGNPPDLRDAPRDAFLGHAALTGAGVDDPGGDVGDVPDQAVNGPLADTDPDSGGSTDDVLPTQDTPRDEIQADGETINRDATDSPWTEGQTVEVREIRDGKDALEASDDEVATFLAEPDGAKAEMDIKDASPSDSQDATQAGAAADESNATADRDLDSAPAVGAQQGAVGRDSLGDRSGGDPDAAQSTDRLPTNDLAVERAWASSEKVDAGRSFVAVGDDMHEGAEKIEATPGEYGVIIHGNTDEVGIHHSTGDWQILDAKQTADVIRSDPDWSGEPVRLISCDTGKRPEDGSEIFGQDVANNLGVDVIAPTESVYYSAGETWVSSSREVTDPLTGDIQDFPSSPPSAPDGDWQVFHPAA